MGWACATSDNSAIAFSDRLARLLSIQLRPQLGVAHGVISELMGSFVASDDDTGCITCGHNLVLQYSPMDISKGVYDHVARRTRHMYCK